MNTVRLVIMVGRVRTDHVYASQAIPRAHDHLLVDGKPYYVARVQHRVLTGESGGLFLSEVEVHLIEAVQP